MAALEDMNCEKSVGDAAELGGAVDDVLVGWVEVGEDFEAFGLLVRVGVRSHWGRGGVGVVVGAAADADAVGNVYIWVRHDCERVAD